MSVWQEIVAKAVDEAREGDHAARAWLAGYLCGKPTGDALRNLAVDEEVGVDPLAENQPKGADGRVLDVIVIKESHAGKEPGCWERTVSAERTAPMRGRKPKPTALKFLDGTCAVNRSYRPSRQRATGAVAADQPP